MEHFYDVWASLLFIHHCFNLSNGFVFYLEEMFKIRVTIASQKPFTLRLNCFAWFALLCYYCPTCSFSSAAIVFVYLASSFWWSLVLFRRAGFVWFLLSWP